MIWLDQKVLELTLPVTMNSFALTKIFESIFCRPLSQSLTAVESALVNESESGSAVAFWIERLQPYLPARVVRVGRLHVCQFVNILHGIICIFTLIADVAKPPGQTAPVVPSDRDYQSGSQYSVPRQQ
jgi:hypothetical protein